MIRPCYIQRCGDAIDCALNVLLFNGDVGQTISLHAAVAQRANRRWGCVLCWLLNWLVQHQHCPKQFDGKRTSWMTFIRASVAIGTLLIAMYGAADLVWRLI